MSTTPDSTPEPTHAALLAWVGYSLRNQLYAGGPPDSNHRNAFLAGFAANEAAAARDAAKADQALDEVMTQRDDYHEWADRLALAIAPESQIGEHSSGNNPWLNALDFAHVASTRTGTDRVVAQMEAAVDAHLEDGSSAMSVALALNPALRARLQAVLTASTPDPFTADCVACADVATRALLSEGNVAGALNRRVLYVCPKCGDKRCAKAADHRNGCDHVASEAATQVSADPALHCTKHEAFDETCLWCRSTVQQMRALELRPEQRRAVDNV